MSYPQSSPFPSENTTSSASLTDEGMRLLQAGNADAALNVLSQAIEQNPSDGVAFQYLGIARAKTGSLDGSIAALREAVRLLPMNAGVQFNLGVSLAQAKQFDEARAVLERARELDPQNSRITASLASLPAASVPSPFTTTASDGLASVGAGMAPSGLSTVGGGSPVPPLPPSAPVLAPTYEPQNTWASNSDTGNYGSYNGGMYSSSSRAIQDRIMEREPTVGERIGRGLGWGAVYAQWWTLLMFFWEVVIGGLSKGDMTGGEAALVTIVFAIFFAFVGAIMGLIMACIRADRSMGAALGIIIGMIFLGIEIWQSGGHMFVNVFFWFFTGRFVGTHMASRINQSVDA